MSSRVEDGDVIHELSPASRRRTVPAAASLLSSILPPGALSRAPRGLTHGQETS